MATKTPQQLIQQHGVRIAMLHLREMGKRARHARPAARAVRKVYLKVEEERFANPRVARWKKLAQSTVDKKARLGQDARMLRVSGALHKSLTAEHGADQIDDAADDAFRFGTKVYYGRFHQRGEGVPKRQLIAATTLRKNPEMDKAISDYLTREGLNR